MFSKLVLLATAFQVAFTSASVKSDTRLTHWLHDHKGHEAHNGTNHQHGDHQNGPGVAKVLNPSTGNKIQTRQAMGNAIVSNRCSYDVWIWSVDQNSGGEPIKLAARTRHEEPFRSPCDGCGVSFKVSTTDQIVDGHHTQFEYAIKDGIVYYDISYVNCAVGESADNCPGHEKGHAIDSPELACGRPNCASGTYCPTQSYYVDYPLPKLGIQDPVFGCGSAGVGMDIYFKMCSDEAPLKRSIAGRTVIDDWA